MVPVLHGTGSTGWLGINRVPSFSRSDVELIFLQKAAPKSGLFFFAFFALNLASFAWTQSPGFQKKGSRNDRKEKTHKVRKKCFCQNKVIRNILSEIAFAVEFWFNFTDWEPDKKQIFSACKRDGTWIMNLNFYIVIRKNK